MDEMVRKIAAINPKDLLSYRTNLGATLDITYHLFHQVILDTIESALLSHQKTSSPTTGQNLVLPVGFNSKNTPITAVSGLNFGSFTSRTSSPQPSSSSSSVPTGIDQNDFIVCSVCKRSIHYAKYAPHLEKCLGMGRVAARAAAVKRNVDFEDDEEFEVMLDQMQQEISNSSGNKRKKTTATSVNQKPVKTVTIRPVEDKDLFDSSFIDFDF